MRSRRTFVAMLGALVALPSWAQTLEPPQRAALSAAERWLVPVDGQRYADAWTMASDEFRTTVPRQEWRDGIRKIRKDYGRVMTRKGEKIAFVGSAPDPLDPSTQRKPGMKVAILFDTKFAGDKHAAEELTMVLEQDGIWRVASYYIK